MSFHIRQVAAGTIDRVMLSFIPRSIGIYNASGNRAITLRSESGDTLQCPAGAILAQPVTPSTAWTITVPAAYRGMAWVDFSEQMRSFVFATNSPSQRVERKQLLPLENFPTITADTSYKTVEVDALTNATNGAMFFCWMEIDLPNAQPADMDVVILGLNARIWNPTSFRALPHRFHVDVPTGARIGLQNLGDTATYTVRLS